MIHPPAPGIDPFGINALQPVFESHTLGVRETYRAIMKLNFAMTGRNRHE